MFEQINEPFKLSREQIDFYRENKYIKIKQVLSPEVLKHYAEITAKKVVELNTMHLPLNDRDTYNKAFLQIMNIWTRNAVVKEFVFSQRIAGIATELMGVSGVRIYHDQALFKEPGGGYTPWHADQYYWPLTSDHTITAWIPFQAVPIEMGPLEFSAKSHLLKDGRNFKISDDSEELIEGVLQKENFKKIVEPFDLGEISFHSGWLFHRAGPNLTDKMRQVMTVIYMDADMRLKPPENENQQNDWDTWCPGAIVHEVINTPLNPIVFMRDMSKDRLNGD